MLHGAALALAAPMIRAKDAKAYSTRTIDLVQRATVIDMLGLLTLNYRKLAAWERDPANFRDVDFLRLQNSGITAFHPAVGFIEGDIYAQTYRDVTGWNSFIERHPKQFLRIEKARHFRQAKESGAIGILIGQQNSAHFRTIDDVDHFYKLGQRVSQLTYHSNRLGGNAGISPYGVEILQRMNTVGMTVDISHCGDKTTLDAIEASCKPVVVTHSNCRALVPGMPRCKTDDAIRRMAKRGGVMGVTMVRGFVRSGGSVTVEHVLDHIDHVVKIAGIEHAGIGSDVDLDGRDVVLRPERRFDLDGIDYAKKIYDITEGLVKRKYSDRNIELILGGNFERVLAQTWIA